jgi:glycosyltransferase involved in cell wall biosynthesis
VLSALSFLRKVIKDKQVSICHCEDFAAVILFLIIKPFVSNKPKILWHVRLLEHTPVRKWLALRFCDGIMGISKSVVDSFHKSPKVHLTPNGFDPNECDPALVKPICSQLLPEQTQIIGFLGEISEQKGASVLMNALPSVLAKHSDVICVFVGSDPFKYIQKLSQLAEQYGIKQHVIFWGESHRADTQSLLKRFTVFVMPSFSEGFSRSLLEALALERPAVASDIAAHKELITNGVNGLLYNVNDFSTCADAINTILADPIKAAEYGKHGRQIAMSNYTIDKTMRSIHEVYDSLNK